MAETYTTRHWLFCGLELQDPFADDPKPVVILRPAAANGRADWETPRSAFAWNAKSFRHLTAGRIYELETSEDGTRIRFGTASNVIDLANEEQRQSIRAADRAATIALDAAKRREKLRKDDLDLPAILEPLRSHYNRCRTRDAAIAFELLVLDALRRGR